MKVLTGDGGEIRLPEVESILSFIHVNLLWSCEMPGGFLKDAARIKKNDKTSKMNLKEMEVIPTDSQQ